ncbi:MAG: hypothetical protein GXP32_04065 [Kiritimatiellaeota bacterium]|nr:hypothetical protein [Kiritimatiellota bacterium]
MINRIVGWTVLFSLLASTVCEAGLLRSSGSRPALSQFNYDVIGEVVVKPTCALFPITLAAKSDSFASAVGKSKVVLIDLKKRLSGLGKSNFSISPTDCVRKKEYRKFIPVSFWGGRKKEKVSVRLKLVLRVSFAEKDDFWTRAGFVAAALDFLKARRVEFKDNGDFDFSYGSVSYFVEDVEKHRERIVESIYSKAKTAADILAKSSKTKSVLRSVRVDQNITQRVENLDKAWLSLGAVIKFEFK